MVEQQKQRPWTSIGIMKRIFWFLCIGALIVGAVVVIGFVLGIVLPLSPSDQSSVDLTLKNMNIILIFFSIVVAFLAFFGYREVAAHQKLRDNLKEQAEKLDREFEERKKESKYMNKLNLVRIFFHLEIYDKASYVMDEIKESLTYEAPLFRGMISGAMRKYQDALRFLKEALRFDLKPKEKARVYFAIARTYMGMGDYEKANLNYDKCLELAPDYLDAYINKAYICKRQKDLDGAMKMINQAIKINDQDAVCHFNRACYHSLKDEKDKVEQGLRIAVELDRKRVCDMLIDKDLARNRNIVKRILNL